MRLNFVQKTLFVILGIIIFLGALLIFLDFKKPAFNVINYISGLSTFSVAILTVIYVYTTSSQLNVMNMQLKEMKMERELQHQPLPWIKKIETYIDAPRFFYSPPEKVHSYYCRYFTEFIIKNIGCYPCICADISAKLIIPQYENILELSSVSLRIDTLEEKQVYPENDLEKDNFLFALDRNAVFMETFIESKSKNPILDIRILYKNTLGACFAINNSYVLSINDEDESKLKEWLSLIRTFPIKYVDELNTLKRLKEEKNEKWHGLFNKVKEEIACSLQKDTDKIVLTSTPIPKTFSMESITKEKYDELINPLSYGTPMALLKGEKCN